MFTIKHVSFNGSETLFQGEEPMFVNVGSAGLAAANQSLSGMFETGQVSYTDAKGEIQTIRGGKVYIMNDAGKTVASYVLEQVPLNAAYAQNLANPAFQNSAA